MNNEPIQDEKLLMFIRGELLVEEQQQLEEIMKSDPNLVKQYNDLLVAQTLIWDAGREQEAAELKKLYVEEQRPFVQRPIFRYMAIAASLLVLAAIAFFVSKPSTVSMDTLYANNYNRPQGIEQLAIPQGQIAQLDSLVRLGHIAYNKENWAEANSTFAMVDTLPGSDSLQGYYLYWGIAQLELGNAEAAIQSFGKMKSNLEARDWYTALAYLKLNDKAGAKHVLNMILEDPERFYYQKAVEVNKLIGE